MSEIHFGTDGWRDIIADGYTMANLAQATQAYADYLVETGGKRVVVGYDTRFLSDRFARRAAEVLAANGLETFLARDYLPTPATSFAVTHLGADGGVMITASHNPPIYNGFKLKGAYGGSATPEIVAGVEKKLAAARPCYDPAAQISEFDIRQEYYQALSGLLDLELLGNTPRTLYHETMGGTGAGWLTGFAKFSGLPLTIHELHGVPSPTFYGVNPEPIPQNLKTALAVLSPESSPVFAAVTDGDADRIGAVLAGGKYFDSHAIFLVLMDHLLKKGGSGRVVKTFPGSRMIELLAQKRGVECQTLPVGFKYVTDEFLKGGVLIGGEESGGIGVAGHIPERDGVLNALLLLEATARAGTGLGEIFAELETEVGYPHAYDRLDLHLPDLAAKDRALEQVREPKPLAGLGPVAVDPLDGIKWIFDDGSWLLFRASGTEPLLRIYCESHSPSQVKKLLGAARKLVGM